MNDRIETTTRSAIASRRNWLHFLFSGAVLLGSLAYYQTMQAEALRHEVALLQRDNTALRASLSKSDGALKKALVEFHSELDRVHATLISVRAETGQGLASAQVVAVHHADALMRQLEKKRRQEEELQRQLRAELNRVKESTAETSTRLNGISNDVGSVRSEVESVRSVAREASSNAEQTRGNLGMKIATNADEIQMLRELGDRNVFEFDLAKSDGVQRVGDIELMVDKTDTRHNSFTVEILAADQRFEKRDRNVNEPVQFYVPGKGSQPYELVVNEVGKNTIRGYLSTPKVTLSRK